MVTRSLKLCLPDTDLPVKSVHKSQTWGLPHVIPALRKLREKDFEFKVGLGWQDCHKQGRGCDSLGRTLARHDAWSSWFDLQH